MGCFPACFGHLRRNLTTKKVQDQCLSPSNEQHECVELLPEITKSQKEEEKIINPIKDFMSESEVKHEDKISASSNSDKEVEEKENEKGKDEKECAVGEESCSSLFSLSIDSRRQVYGAEIGEKEVSSLMKTKYRSLENDDEKEKVALSKDEMIIQQTFEKSKAVETSLSTWLVESRMSGGSSPESANNYGDRQILGVVSSTADVKKEESDVNCWINVEA